jgi:hypothetical protein
MDTISIDKITGDIILVSFKDTGIEDLELSGRFGGGLWMSVIRCWDRMNGKAHKINLN